MEETKLSTKVLEFLNKKPLFYDTIDYDRFPSIYHSIKEKLPLPKIIHLVGTNAKGTTGRFLAQAIHSSGATVGHYTSPHILSFNERIWINGANIDDNALEEAHQKLLLLLTPKQAQALSYFEYTTLLAMIAFEKCEYVVLEAGLGGERDATAVFDTILTIATVIDYDHQDFLGDDIVSIATTKLNAAKRHLLLSQQKHKEVIEVAKTITKKKNIPLSFVPPPTKTTQEIAKKLHLASYLVHNLQTAIEALSILQIKNYTISQVQLFGRLTQIAPNIIIDVGHNPLAANAIKEALFPKKYTLIYNSFADKDYEKILQILQPIIEDVEIITINNSRIEKIAKLQRTLKQLKIKYSILKQIEPTKNYLVFGSFVVVEEFLKQFYEQNHSNNHR